MSDAKIGFIGGSGLYDMEALTDTESVNVRTPFGDPSDDILVGDLAGTRVAFLPRHGKGHRYSPTEMPVHANIYALKTLGVERIVSISAVGSLQEEYAPLDVVVPDQLIDRTRSRTNTFFSGGIVAHISFADPFCPDLRKKLVGATSEHSITAHDGGTYVVMEGPQFSTRAESALYRSWGASIIGMTALPEAKLAKEAEMCYATLAMVTDYDVWHETEEEVTVELIIANLLKNVAASQRVVETLVPRISGSRACDCDSTLKDAIITAPEYITNDIRERLSAIIGKYVPHGAD